MASTKKKRTTATSKQAASTTKKTVASEQRKKAVAKEVKQVPVEQIVVPASTAKTPLFELKQWNTWLAWIFALQGVAILLLSASRLLPISSSFITPNPLVGGSVSLVPATHHLFDLSLGWMVAIFFFISAAAHTLLATVYRKRYEAEGEQGINRVRSIDQGLSSGIMLVIVALLCGVYDVATLLAIFAFSVIAGLAGLATEIYNQDKEQVNWLAFSLSCVANAVPWIITAFYLFSANVYGMGHIPAYVYAVFGTMLVLMNLAKFGQYLQYTKKGKWASYAYRERAYMVLSLVAKTALAWQIFAGTLHP